MFETANVPNPRCRNMPFRNMTNVCCQQSNNPLGKISRFKTWTSKFQVRLKRSIDIEKFLSNDVKNVFYEKKPFLSETNTW